MKYQGKGKLKFKGKSYKVLVTLDPTSGYITAKFPMGDSRSAFNSIYGDQNIFKQKYAIRDLRIELPYGAIEHDNLSNLYIKSIQPGTLSVYDSFLVRSFNLYEKEIGISTIVFFPESSLLNFTFKGASVNKSSELIFTDIKLGSSPGLQVKLKSLKHLLLFDNNILIMKASSNLLPKRNQFYRALSLLGGGKAIYRAGFFKNNIQINFIRSDRSNCLGPLFKKDTDKQEFIEKYWEYESTLDKKKKNRQELFIEYFLEGMSANTNLENRIISLYTALEIVDNSKTLNKQSISQTFNLDPNVADIVAKFRNKLIHQGYSGSEALAESIKEVKARISLKRTPFKTSGRSKNRSLFNYYLFLVICLYKKCFKDIGFADRNIQYAELMKK